MQINALVEPLLNVPLFQGLKPLQLTEIARRADRIVYKAGDVVVAENARGEAAVLIISGEAKRGGERVPPGTLLGEIAMLIETGYSASVVAMSEVRAIRISRSELLEQMQEDPAMAAHFAQKLSARLDTFLGELRQIDSFLAPEKSEAAVPEPEASAGAVPAAGEEDVPVSAAA